MAPPASRVPPRGYFITGTDTGVGKTLVSCGMLRAANALSLRAVGMKPVAAGAERRGGDWINEDVEALRAAGNVHAPLAEMNPYCFAPPIAPHIAAAATGVNIDAEVIVGAYRALCARADIVIVEGAGGYLVPLGKGKGFDMADLARTLELPVVMVVGMRLGCLNHALLTAHAIRSRGSVLAGWVANHVEPCMAHSEENIEALAGRLDAPLLARVPHGAAPDAVAALLSGGTLLAGLRRVP